MDEWAAVMRWFEQQAEFWFVVTLGKDIGIFLSQYVVYFPYMPVLTMPPTTVPTQR